MAKTSVSPLPVVTERMALQFHSERGCITFTSSTSLLRGLKFSFAASTKNSRKPELQANSSSNKKSMCCSCTGEFGSATAWSTAHSLATGSYSLFILTPQCCQCTTDCRPRPKESLSTNRRLTRDQGRRFPLRHWLCNGHVVSNPISSAHRKAPLETSGPTVT